MTISGTPVRSLDDEGTYTYLGIQIGVHSRTKIDGILSLGLKDAETLCSSQLAPWQIIDAIKTFIIPRFTFFIRNGDPLLQDLKAFDNKLSALVKNLISCPNKGTSRHYLYGDAKKGGLGVPSLVDEYHVSSVACLARLLFSKDKAVAEYFNGEFTRVVSKWTKPKGPGATPVDRVDFLNCSSRFDGRLVGSESHSLWTRMRRSTRHLQKFLGTFEFTLLENDSLGIRVDRSNRVLDLSKSHSTAILRRFVHQCHIRTMVTEYKSQGKVLAAVSMSESSSKFLRDGLYVSFSAYKWIHRARLNLHRLNATSFGISDNRCRRCGEKETLPHVIQHCKQAMTLITKRHNAVQDRLVAAIPKKAGRTVTTNVSIPISSNRPDIVVKDDQSKEVIIIDVTVPFENGYKALKDAYNRKIAKYESEKKKLESEGYKVTLTTFVIGSLGTWFSKNTHCLKELGVRKSYTRKMIPLMLSEVVENSKNIFWRHILADKFRIIASRASKGSAPTTKETQISPRTSSSAIKLPEDRKRPRTTSPLPRPSPKRQKIRGKRAPRKSCVAEISTREEAP
ncbi:hypothetical protein L596_025970 [Steinernema carpocapsae]|uniref:Reverse transcriptase zinc-binding domain-containing protein n=1 Tax=Steinernema carpocapsae TaxID=34508 RepID=A0A4U5MB42_STECR|nr:hypothetical protein L596_025970 [Steinernema carpocapsae]